jgi:hypothetical protein
MPAKPGQLGDEVRPSSAPSHADIEVHNEQFGGRPE